jgi:hypothetical protein
LTKDGPKWTAPALEIGEKTVGGVGLLRELKTGKWVRIGSENKSAGSLYGPCVVSEKPAWI